MPSQSRKPIYGRGACVGRGRGGGLDLGVGAGRGVELGVTVGLGVAVAVAVGVTVGVAVGVAVGVVVGVGVRVAVAVGVGVGVGVPLGVPRPRTTATPLSKPSGGGAVSTARSATLSPVKSRYSTACVPALTPIRYGKLKLPAPLFRKSETSFD